MPGFKEWLLQQREKVKDGPQRRARIEEWQETINTLFEQIRNWLREDDPEELLGFRFSSVRKQEEGLGEYFVPILEIDLGAKSVDIVPLARNVLGGVIRRDAPELKAEGRVDMTNGAEKYMLYRVKTPDGLKWVIIDDERYQVKDLNKETFEAALQDLLS